MLGLLGVLLTLKRLFSLLSYSRIFSLLKFNYIEGLSFFNKLSIKSIIRFLYLGYSTY